LTITWLEASVAGRPIGCGPRQALASSNLVFIIYGLGLMPVWLFHAVLLPVNTRRLVEALRSERPLATPRSRNDHA